MSDEKSVALTITICLTLAFMYLGIKEIQEESFLGTLLLSAIAATFGTLSYYLWEHTK